jgi:tetratricopeptide (TPR) repeat protein
MVYTYEKFPLSTDLVHISMDAFQSVIFFTLLLLLLFTLIVLPLDFLGIGITRAKNDISLKTGLFIFLLDTLAKAVLFPIILTVSSIVYVFAFILMINYFGSVDILALMHFNITIGQLAQELLKNMSVSSIISISSMLLAVFYPFYPVMVPSFILCSAWVWLYLVGLHLVRRAVFLFDVDKQPVRSIGIIGAAVLTGCYGVYATIEPRPPLYYASNSEEIAILFNQNYDRAVAHYSKAIGLDPTSSLAFQSRGAAYFAKQDYDLAIADYTEAIRLDPKFAVAFNNRGLAYFAQQGYDQAIADYTEAIRLNPKNTIPFKNRGDAYFAKRNYDATIADYTEAIRLNSNDAIAFNNRGYTYAAKQDYDQAIANFTEAIRLDPKYALAFDNRGRAYAAKKDYDHAIADYDEAIRLGLKTTFTFDDRGRVYAAKQDYEHAIADFTEAIRLDPKYGLAFNNRGLAYAAKQDYDNAIADYNEAIRLDPKSAIALNNRGRAYIATQDYNSAIADYNEAIRLDPKFAVAFRRRGIVNAVKQDYDHAIDDLTEAVRLDPESAGAVLWLCLARARSGAKTAAAELETNAKHLKQPDWPYPLIELFLGHRTLKATLAAATNPSDHCTAQFYVGEWHLLQDHRVAAKMALKAAVDICPRTLIEYDVARAELQRLRQ